MNLQKLKRKEVKDEIVKMVYESYRKIDFPDEVCYQQAFQISLES